MTAAPAHYRDLPRLVFSVLAIGALLAASLWILRPFLPAMVWSTLIVVATWRLMVRLQAAFHGRRSLAVAVMTGLLAGLFMLPVVLAIGILVTNAGEIAAWLRSLLDAAFEGPPAWVEGLPLVGSSTASAWRRLIENGPTGIAEMLTPYADRIASWFAASIGGIGELVFDMVLTVICAGVLYARGEQVTLDVRRFAQRLAGHRGDHAVLLAAEATRAIAFGVVATALVQAVVGGLGLLIAGVPAWLILTAIMFLTSIAQLGAAPILACAAGWTFLQGHTGWGIALVVWTLVVGSLDNVLRPMLIGREAKLSFLMVFAGVLGGLVAFGPVGLFAGPVVLAVTGSLLGAWLRQEHESR
ncbi:MAG: AI-2E family transporter YdiK [Planctomycetota bacterium]